MEASRRISVVIVNWNAGRALFDCLESLYAQHPGYKLDIVLVDNASRDGSMEAVGRAFPEVRRLTNRTNRGFGAACNQGFAAVDPSNSFVLVLNPDTQFRSDCLGPLAGFLESEPEAAAVGPRVVGLDGALQRGCRRREPTPFAMLSRSLGLDRLFAQSRTFAGYTYGDIPADHSHAVDSLSGSCMLIRQSSLDEVGGFDERFFMYAEDLDWCRRAREAGWKVYFHPEAEVVHQRAVSTVQRPFGRLWDINHTAVQYIRKHHRAHYPLPARLALYLGLAARLVLGLPTALCGSLLTRRRKTKV